MALQWLSSRFRMKGPTSMAPRRRPRGRHAQPGVMAACGQSRSWRGSMKCPGIANSIVVPAIDGDPASRGGPGREVGNERHETLHVNRRCRPWPRVILRSGTSRTTSRLNFRPCRLRSMSPSRNISPELRLQIDRGRGCSGASAPDLLPT